MPNQTSDKGDHEPGETISGPNLTGLQIRQIQQALLSAFDKTSLRQLVRLELDEELDAVAGGDTTTATVLNLIQWAERTHRVGDLVDGALRQNPNNPALLALSEAISVWHVEAPAGAKEECPYKGMAFYDVGESALFYGRERLTAELVDFLGAHSFLAVVGASGSGKSSVARAGVVAALMAGALPASERWTVRIVTPTARPLVTLAAALTRESESVTAQATLIDDMSRDPRSLDLFATRMVAGTQSGRILLVVDQFEELFTLCKDPAATKAYIGNLLAAANEDGVTKVLLTLRADFYAHCAEFEELRHALQANQRYIGPMTRQELVAAIENPAVYGGWELEAGLANRLLKEVVEQPGALPLLSHSLLETWKRRSGRMLTLAGYEASGGVQGAIALTAEGVFGNLPAERQAIARNIFVRLTSLSDKAQETRRRVALSELLGSGSKSLQIETVLQQLADSRLVTVEMAETPTAQGDVLDTIFVDVAHEALIREWPRLQGWLEDDRSGLLIHRRLTRAAEEWAALGKDPGALFRGVLLAQTAEWARSHAENLNELEQEFLGASTAHMEAEQREREEIQRRELEQARQLVVTERNRAAEAAKARNNLRWLLAATTALLLGTALAALFILEQNRQLDVARNLADRNAGLANTQLAQLQGEQLLQKARELQSRCDVENARATLQEALANNPKLMVDIDHEMAGTRRACAGHLVDEGEDLVRQGNFDAGFARFEQALDLNPPPDTRVYVWIEPGEFVMGSNDGDAAADPNEKPEQHVALGGYWIQRTEVTNGQYAPCVADGACEPPNNKRWDKEQFANYPVTDVNWRQAADYAAWRGGSLPTEAEWEKACRSADGRLYAWGNEPPSDDRLNMFQSGLGTSTTAGSYPPGAYGLFDMSGNVWEWTSTLFDLYPYDAQDGREDPAAADDRVMRGGSYAFEDSSRTRCAARFQLDPQRRFDNLGFRVVIAEN